MRDKIYTHKANLRIFLPALCRDEPQKIAIHFVILVDREFSGESWAQLVDNIGLLSTKECYSE